MSFIKTWVLLALVAMMIAGCSPAAPTPTPAPTQPVEQQQATGYPIGIPEQNGYPAGDVTVAPLPTPDMSAFVTDTPDVVKSPVIISSVTTENGLETITLKNISGAVQDVSKWILWQPDEDARFFLPDSLSLAPEQTFTLYNGAAQDKPAELVWTDHTMLNNRDDYIVLLNFAGRVIYYYVVR